MYVALTSIRSLENMYLIGKYTQGAIKTNTLKVQLKKKNMKS